MASYATRRYEEGWGGTVQPGSFHDFRDELAALCSAFELDLQRPPTTHYSKALRMSPDHSVRRAKDILREQKRQQRRLAAVKLHTYLAPISADGRLEMSLAVAPDPQPATLTLSQMTPDGKYHGVVSLEEQAAMVAHADRVAVDHGSPFISADTVSRSNSMEDDQPATPIPASMILQSPGRSYEAIQADLMAAYSEAHRSPRSVAAAANKLRREAAWNAKPLARTIKLADSMRESELAVQVRNASSSRAAYDKVSTPTPSKVPSIEEAPPPATTLRGGDDSRLTRIGTSTALAAEPPHRYHDPSGIVLYHLRDRTMERQQLHQRMTYTPPVPVNPFCQSPKPSSPAAYEALRRHKEKLDSRCALGFEHRHERRANPQHQCVASRSAREARPSGYEPLAPQYDLGLGHGLVTPKPSPLL